MRWSLFPRSQSLPWLSCCDADDLSLSTVPKVLTQDDLDLNFSGGVDGFKQLFERCLIQIVSIAPKGMLNRANIPSREFYGLIVRHRYLPRPSVMIAVGNSRVSVIVGSYRE